MTAYNGAGCGDVEKRLYLCRDFFIYFFECGPISEQAAASTSGRGGYELTSGWLDWMGSSKRPWSKNSFRARFLVVGRQGKIVWRKAYGDSQWIPERRPMQLSLLFDLASLTKPLATTTFDHDPGGAGQAPALGQGN